MRLDEKPGSVGLMGGARDLTVRTLGEKTSGSVPAVSKTDPTGFAPSETAPGSTAPFRTVRAGRSYQVPAREPRPADPGAAEAAARLGGRRAYRLAKRAFDAAFSAVVLVALSPLMALVALAVKADGTGGPVLFRQVRVGKDGREFEMYKFRTMVPGAEGRLGELKALNEKTGPVFKMRDDPRVTKIGRFLRRTSLDELPQFANVLKGDMSVVGPRPALPSEVASYGERERQRLLVEQGLTSYWQARPDRDSVSFDEWVDLDLAYVRDCGPWTDLKLIVKTVGVVLTAQGS